MTLHSTAAALAEPSQAARLAAQVDVLDATIARIRETIYQLNAPRTPREPLRNRLVEVVVAAVDALGFDPTLRLTGPIDQVQPGLADDTVAVAREALSNCARHAAATTVAVSVSAADGWLVVEVVDDGRGIGSPTRSSGLTNLRRRAEARGGALRLEPTAAARGTSLVWSARLAVADEPGAADEPRAGDGDGSPGHG